MSRTAAPTDNAAVERSFRTFKSQLNKLFTWPEQFESLYKAQVFVDRVVNLSNTEHKAVHNQGL
jgi:hypothetical protein